MEINWKMLKAGLLFGAIMASIQFLNAITAFQTPPDWWTMLRLAIVPALGILLTTVLQYCPKGPPKIDNVIKCILIVFMCAVFLGGCSSMQSGMAKAGQIDLKNATATRQLAKDLLSTWKLNSGFIRGALGPKISELPNQAVEAMKELDALAEKTDANDYDLGYSLGVRVRMLGSVVMEAFKLYSPEVLKFVPSVLAL